MCLRTIIICCTICTVLCSDADSQLWTNDDGDSGPLSQACMRCICQVMGCRRNSRVTCSGNTCGPFDITHSYWRTAFDRTDEDMQKSMKEYRECTKNSWCAARTVQNYMKRKLPACMRQKKHQAPCDLALLLHMHGGDCNEDVSPNTIATLHECLERQLWEWLGH